MQTLAYFAAVLVPQMVATAAIAYMEVSRPGGDLNSNTTTVIIGMATAASAQLVLLVKSISNGRKADLAATTAVETKKDVVEAVKKLGS